MVTKAQKDLDIHVTDKAAKMISTFAKKQSMEDYFSVRVGVKGGGCSGLTYNLAIDDQDPTVDDRVVHDNGIRILVDKKSFVYLAGTELDFSDGLNGKGFVFNNPNATKSCGCGNSFSV